MMVLFKTAVAQLAAGKQAVGCEFEVRRSRATCVRHDLP
jgi:hypothetical protein